VDDTLDGSKGEHQPRVYRLYRLTSPPDHPPCCRKFRRK